MNFLATSSFVPDGILLATLLILAIFLARSVVGEITNRKKIKELTDDLGRAEIELRLLKQQKSKFTSIASDRLRNPLTAIKGYASMVLEGSFGKTDEGVENAVRRILESSQHLGSVAEELLTLTRIEKGDMKFEFIEVDLKKMAKDLIANLKPNAQIAGLLVTYGDSGHKGYHVLADYEKLRQVVMNLIDNAIKYTPKGEVSVFMAADDRRGTITLSVTDSGIGIPKELAGRLFEKFSRGEGISKINTDGFGLGLYVGKEIVEAHKGRIWAESRGEGKGSTFYMELTQYNHKGEGRAAHFNKIT